MALIKRALISVTDKTGVVEFAAGLRDLGVEIISTGGTARALHEGGVAVREVSEVTGFPEMLDGRLKTINPRIAGGVLAMRANPEHMQALAQHQIPAIDMVVVNLYAFEKVAARHGASMHELIENIDIGGPTLIRAAAKNYQDVAVVASPDDYAAILEELHERNGELCEPTLWRLAQKAFALTAAYDRAISTRLSRVGLEEERGLPAFLDIRAPRALDLRYGENPHQSAALYTNRRGGIAGAEQLQGKELSYNNLVDLDAAWQLIQEFEQPASAIIKHTNPCGCAEADNLAESYRRAFEADPVSAFGGVLAFNRTLDEETAREIAKTFIEAIAAPDYEPGARSALAGKKNLRMLKVDPAPDEPVVKSISGGYLVQTPDDAPSGSRAVSGEDRACAQRGRMASAAIRLEGVQARKVERHCVCARRPECQRGRRPNEPRGFRQGGRDEGGAAAPRHRDCFGRFLPVPRWSGGSSQTRHHGGDPARRVRAR